MEPVSIDVVHIQEHEPSTSCGSQQSGENTNTGSTRMNTPAAALQDASGVASASSGGGLLFQQVQSMNSSNNGSFGSRSGASNYKPVDINTEISDAFVPYPAPPVAVEAVSPFNGNRVYSHKNG